MTLRVFEAFTGVGSQRMALRNLGIDHEVVATSDVDEFTVKSYAAIHDNDKVAPEETSENMEAYLENRNIPLDEKGVRKILKGSKLREFYEACIKSNNLGDISKIVTQDIPDHDLFTYSFPCQDISTAGNGLGLDEGSGTRSGLLWECQKIITAKKPKYLLLENVKNLVGKRHKPNFDKWLEWLEEQGYTNYWQVLNAKNYGVPQNRERVFVVSILGEHEPYKFPEPQPLTVRLRDILDEEVDEKFYLTEVQTERLIQNSDCLQDLASEPKINILAHRKKYRRNTQVFDPNGITETLDTGQGGGRGHYTISNSGITKIGNVNPSGNGMNGNVFHADGLSPTITINKGEGYKVYIGASRGRNPENPSDRTVGSQTEQRLEINKQGTTVQKDNYVVEAKDFRIRKLTPLECWRLMGFSDEDFHKAEAVNSNSQLYKQAGNSIVVPVLEAIFKQLLEGK